MSSMAPTARPVREAVLRELVGKEIRPIDLLSTLGHEGYAESDIKEALSELLREGRIELTHQRVLKATASQDAA
jgi:hypothetical protein